jgi:phosphohistidine phosphatase SixA
MKLLYFIFAVLIFFSCAEKVELAGKDIDHILFDQILMQDGTSYKLSFTDSTQVFYLVRHAEKDTMKTNPPLTSGGELRAKKLDQIFKKTRLDKIYSTMTIRTIMTVQEVSSAKGMKILPYDSGKLAEFSNQLLLDASDKSVFVVGHSNTTPKMYELLSGQECPVTIEESDFGYLFIVVKDGSITRDAFYVNY